MSQTQQGLPARQVYSFEGAPPEASQPSGRGGMWAILGVFALLALGIIVFSNSSQTPTYNPRPISVTPVPAPAAAPPAPAPVSRPTYTIGHPGDSNIATTWEEARIIPCPTSFKAAGGGGFERCQAIDLPANGTWIRRNRPEGRGYVVPGFFNVEARGCDGQIYVLAQGGPQFNASCGYTDFRSTDGQGKVFYEGINPQ